MATSPLKINHNRREISLFLYPEIWKGEASPNNLLLVDGTDDAVICLLLFPFASVWPYV